MDSKAAPFAPEESEAIDLTRGSEGSFGGKTLLKPYVWLAFCAIFLLGLFDFRRWRRIVHLDLLVLLSFGISEIFEAFLSSCWLGVRKPIRRFYRRGLGIAHATAETSLFIDDRPTNLIPASALGMNVIHFKSAAQLRSDLERLLDLELSGA